LCSQSNNKLAKPISSIPFL